MSSKIERKKFALNLRNSGPQPSIFVRSFSAITRLLSQPKGTVEKSIRTFPTTTRGLTELDHWLEEGKVAQVALESTGIYWRPIFNLLEGRYEVILVNAKHMHAIVFPQNGY